MSFSSSGRYCLWLWLVSSIGYFVGVVTPYWVIEDYHSWGLWYRRDVNGTGDGNTTTSEYQFISFEQSPGYFKGVYALVIVTTAVEAIFLLSRFCYDSNRGLYEASGFLHYAGVSWTLFMLYASYETDDRWKDSNPRLGWSFWLVCGYDGVGLGAFIVILITTYNNSPRPPAPGQRRCTLCCCVINPTVPTVTRRPSNASSLSIDTGKRITIFHSKTSYLSSIQAGQINLAFEPSDLSDIRL